MSKDSQLRLKGIVSGLRQVLANENPFNDEKYFLFHQLFSFSRYSSFCLDFLVIYKNSLIIKILLHYLMLNFAIFNTFG